MIKLTNLDVSRLFRAVLRDRGIASKVVKVPGCYALEVEADEATALSLLAKAAADLAAFRAYWAQSISAGHHGSVTRIQVD